MQVLAKKVILQIDTDHFVDHKYLINDIVRIEMLPAGGWLVIADRMFDDERLTFSKDLHGNWTYTLHSDPNKRFIEVTDEDTLTFLTELERSAPPFPRQPWQS